MFKKYSSAILIVLALTLVLSIGVTFAQSTPARGGIVMVQESPWFVGAQLQPAGRDGGAARHSASHV